MSLMLTDVLKKKTFTGCRKPHHIKTVTTQEQTQSHKVPNNVYLVCSYQPALTY